MYSGFPPPYPQPDHNIDKIPAAFWLVFWVLAVAVGAVLLALWLYVAT